MINNRMNEGVGKRIVEALKKQNDIEIVPVDEDKSVNAYSEPENLFENEPLNVNFDEAEEPFLEELPVEQSIAKQQPVQNFKTPALEEINSTMKFTNMQENINQTPAINSTMNFAKDLDDFELPNNISVLKQLILQLPSGVTKQIGALIIRQTMEALGISMKNVLQEAQQVQENINSSSRECQANIMEYKRQIVLMENQVQKYSKQYAALNDIISLFIQTGN